MARKVTNAIVDAWLDGRAKAHGNTSTDGTTIFLHGNAIVRRRADGATEVTTAGWDTVTTRERLNGVPGVSVYHAKRRLYLNGELWDGAWHAV